MNDKARTKWANEEEILARYVADMKRADELGLTRLSGTISAGQYCVENPEESKRLFMKLPFAVLAK